MVPFFEVVMAKSPARAPVVRKRKNILVDQRKLDAARSALGAPTETATIDAALDLVVFRTEVFGALDRVAADGGFAQAGRAAAWSKTGLVLSRANTASIGASWQNDLLLAHTAREFGWTLIMRDKDFTRMRPLVKGLRIEAPFPRRPGITRRAV